MLPTASIKPCLLLHWLLLHFNHYSPVTPSKPRAHFASSEKESWSRTFPIAALELRQNLRTGHTSQSRTITIHKALKHYSKPKRYSFPIPISSILPLWPFPIFPFCHDPNTHKPPSSQPNSISPTTSNKHVPAYPQKSSSYEFQALHLLSPPHHFLRGEPSCLTLPTSRAQNFLGFPRCI